MFHFASLTTWPETWDTTIGMHNMGKGKRPKNFFQPKVPPEWVTKPQDEEVVEGQDITFPCKVTGVPQPTVVWRKLAGKFFQYYLISKNNLHFQ